MSKQIRREIKIVPAQVSITEHVQFVYACRKCEKEEISTPVITAPRPKVALPGSMASASSIAYIINEKFVKGIPLYRQEQEMSRLGIEISRQTMANWMILSSQRWLELLYENMKEHLVEKDILHADETKVQVLKEPGRSAISNSYMWLYRTGRGESPIILYDYQTTRASKHPRKFLKDFKGYLHVDGYEGYSNMPKIKLVGCLAHARRKFDEALKAMPKTDKDKPSVAQEGMNFCNKLFKIERELKSLDNEERYKKRLEKSKPLLDNFEKWLKYQTSRVLPKSKLGVAIKYCRNQWNKLTSFLLDGRLEIDNNRSERAIKPFVIGRKNWLFSNTSKGAKSSAVIYSIVETAKENGLKPFEYLKFLFEKLPNINIKDKNEIDKLLPWSKELPEALKVKANI